MALPGGVVLLAGDGFDDVDKGLDLGSLFGQRTELGVVQLDVDAALKLQIHVELIGWCWKWISQIDLL